MGLGRRHARDDDEPDPYLAGRSRSGKDHHARSSITVVWRTILMKTTRPNHALQRTAARHQPCIRGPLVPPSLSSIREASLGRWSWCRSVCCIRIVVSFGLLYSLRSFGRFASRDCRRAPFVSISSFALMSGIPFPGLRLYAAAFRVSWRRQPNHALQRTAARHQSWIRGPSLPPSLSSIR